MKRAIFAVLLAVAIADRAYAGEVTVNVTGLKTVSRVYAAACRKDHFLSKTFLAECNVVASAPVSAGAAIIILENVPEERLAVMVFHDVNGNGRLDFNMLGMPSEPGGFSGPDLQFFPNFEESALDIGSEPISISVKLRCLLC